MNPHRDIQGVVFNIQHYSIHDGPGIRTTVFLKGCPLRCFWCQNPESQVLRPVLFFNPDKCTGCGLCVEACPDRAVRIVDGRSETDRSLCQGHGACVPVCPAEARSLMGQTVTAGEVFDEVNEDAVFYQNSGGGVTLSGGDPVAQPDFSIGILKLCREAGIHTAIETCGHAPWGSLKAILVQVDLVLFDFKHMNPERHKQYTGASNQRALGNAEKIRRELNLPMLARVPVVPGANDSMENLERTAAFIAGRLGRDVVVHLLPYHRLGETKYQRMGAPEKIVPVRSPGDDDMETFKNIFESFDLKVHIGG